MNHPPLKRASTFFLKAVIVLIGVAVLALSAFFFPQMWEGGAQEIPEFRYVLYPALIGIYLTVIPFFFALYQAFMLLRNIDANNAFSGSSVNALGTIKYCAVAITACYMACMPLVYVFAELDDAPGAILIGFALACTPLIVATFAAVLQKLVQNAVDMKAEHDLTV